MIARPSACSNRDLFQVQQGATKRSQPDVARVLRAELRLPFAEALFAASDLMPGVSVVADLHDQGDCSVRTAVAAVANLDDGEALGTAQVELDPRLFLFEGVKEDV